MSGFGAGGNTAHLAPEVLNAKPGPRKFLDYRKQPVWAAGVLAYELAGTYIMSFEPLYMIYVYFFDEKTECAGI